MKFRTKPLAELETDCADPGDRDIRDLSLAAQGEDRGVPPEPRPPYLSSSTSTATATPATATSTMASPPILSFDAEGRPIKFETWLDDLHLFLQLTAREDISLYDHALGTVPPPATTAAATARSQWQTRDAHARFAIRNSLPVDEREHFSSSSSSSLTRITY
ncbi:unnamed protein product [Closterium sp. NIES-54]